MRVHNDLREEPLGKDDVAALRMATDLTLVASSEGDARIVAYRRFRGETPTRQELRLFPTLKPGISDGEFELYRGMLLRGSVTAFSLTGGPTVSGDLLGRFFMHSAGFDPAWQTIARKIIKPGYNVSLQFKGDHHTNELMRERGVHGDVVELWLRRDSERLVVQLPGVPIALNNSARVICPMNSPQHATTGLSLDRWFPAEEEVGV